jgi:Tfp pilus assembly protein PilN
MSTNQLSRPDVSGFLPTEYVERRTEAKFYIIVFLLFMVVMTGVAGAFLVTQRRWNEVRASQVHINALYKEEQVKLEQLRSLETQRSEMLDKAKITSALLEPVPRSVMMAELVGRLPEKTTLFHVKLNAERLRDAPPPPAAAGTPQARARPAVGTLSGNTTGQKPPARTIVAPPRFRYTLSIDGVCPDNKQVADYLASLQSSPLLSNVELEFIETKVINSSAYRGFRISAVLRDNADARQVESAREVERDALASVLNEEGM